MHFVKSLIASLLPYRTNLSPSGIVYRNLHVIKKKWATSTTQIFLYSIHKVPQHNRFIVPNTSRVTPNAKPTRLPVYLSTCLPVCPPISTVCMEENPKLTTLPPLPLPYFTALLSPPPILSWLNTLHPLPCQ